MSWTKFTAYALVFYILINAFFAGLYVICGPKALIGPNFDGLEYTLNAFLRAFFFSVETFGTIGYGHIAPYSLAANVVITIESVLSLFSVALTTGLVFARFSRPTARIAYSENAVVAPYQSTSGFMFRCANARKNQLIDVTVRVLYSRLEERNGLRIRQFTTLPLEFERVTFFTLSWTVVHPIDEQSPLFNITDDDLVQNDAEFLVLLSGIDDTFAQTVHSRTSYKAHEIIWGAKYTSIFVESPDNGVIGMDLSRIHDVEAAELPSR
jgi:inward rectifier potassium channel